MRAIITAVMIALTGLAFVPGAYAHGPDSAHHNVSAEKAGEVAKENVSRLVEEGKLHRSWLDAGDLTVEKREYESGPEYMVVITNPGSPDSSQRTLYVFVSMRGEYLAANFTGK